MFELCEQAEQLGNRHRRGATEFLGERVIGHVTDSERIAAAVQGHSALVRALPVMADVPVSLVGGAVRDALLGIPHGEDVDLVVEGDAVALATRLGQALNARVVSHGRFGTAIVELPHEEWIDVAMARRERYPHPGALPVVEPGTLADDLTRRDFTINAMAYRLTGPEAGVIVDPLGGRADLDAGLVRALRDDSFEEDPTRLLRAVRYAARLGFALDPATDDAARRVAPTLDPTSARVGDELRRLLREPSAPRAIAHAAELGVPWLRADADGLDAFATNVRASLDAPGAPQLAPWALLLGRAVSPEVLPRLAVDGWARGIGLEVTWADRLRHQLQSISKPSEIDEALRRAKPATVVAAHAEGAPVIGQWWSAWRQRTLQISGEHLVAAGISPGPGIGRGLAAARAALLDGAVGDDAEAQLAIARTAALGEGR